MEGAAVCDMYVIYAKKHVRVGVSTTIYFLSGKCPTSFSPGKKNGTGPPTVRAQVIYHLTSKEVPICVYYIVCAATGDYQVSELCITLTHLSRRFHHGEKLIFFLFFMLRSSGS